MFGRTANVFENSVRTLTQAKSQIRMVLLKTHQQELINSIFPAVKAHLIEKKENDKKDFENSWNVISDDKFHPGAQVMIVYKTSTSFQ